MPSISASKPAITVQLDKPRQIRYTWASANRFEEAYGRSIPEAMTVNLGVRLITYLAWSGMLHEEQSLTVRETERRISAYINAGGDIHELSTKLLKALMESGVLGKMQVKTDEELAAEAAAEGNASPQE